MQATWSKQDQADLAGYLLRSNNRLLNHLRANPLLPGGLNASEPRLLGQMEGWAAFADTIDALSCDEPEEPSKEASSVEPPDLDTD